MENDNTYKIRRNPPPISDEQIQKHQDFGKLMHDYQTIYKANKATKPLYKNYKFLSLMVVIGAVLLVLVLDQQESKTENVQKAKMDSTSEQVLSDTSGSLINSVSTQERPITPTANKQTTPALIDIPANTPSFTLDNRTGGIWYLQSKTRLLIPPLSVADAQGIPLEGTVEILYISQTPSQESSAQLPPGYTAGQQVEIRLKQKGLTFIKPLQIEQVDSKYAELKMFDLNGPAVTEQKELSRLSCFFILALPDEYPQLQMFKNLAWQLPYSTGVNNHHIFSKIWSSVKLNDVAGVANATDMQVTGLHSTFNGRIMPMSMTANEDLQAELFKAMMTLYQVKSGKAITDLQKSKAEKLISAWENSPEGKSYYDWMQNSSGDFFRVHHAVYVFPLLGNKSYTLAALKTTAQASSNDIRYLRMNKTPSRPHQYPNQYFRGEIPSSLD